MNSKLIRALGLAATIIGMGATLISEWVNNKKLDEQIEIKVNEAITKRDEK